MTLHTFIIWPEFSSELTINKFLDSTVAALLVVSRVDNYTSLNQGITSLVDISQDLDEIVLVCNGISLEDLKVKVLAINDLPSRSLKVVTHEKLINFGPALNLGLENINSTWVMRVDPDDTNLKIRVNLFKNLINLFDFDIFSTSMLNNSKKSKTSTEVHYPRFEADYKSFLWLKNPIAHPTVFFKRKKIIECGAYRDIPHMEDYDLWIRLSSLNSVFFSVNIPTVIFNFNALKKRRRNFKVFKSEFHLLASKKTYLNLNLFLLITSFFIRALYYLNPFRSNS